MDIGLSGYEHSSPTFYKGETFTFTPTIVPSGSFNDLTCWAEPDVLDITKNTGTKSVSITPKPNASTGQVKVLFSSATNPNPTAPVKSFFGIVKDKPEEDMSELPTDLFIQKTVWKFFTENGFTEKQTAGIMGNIMQESSWNPLRRGSGSSFWGLVQLGRSFSLELERQYEAAGLNLTEYGYDVKTYQGIGAQKNIPRNDLAAILDVQLNYIYGCKPTSRDWISPLMDASSVEEAAEVFLVRFEGAVEKTNLVEDNKIKYFLAFLDAYYQETSKRRNYALQYYEMRGDFN